MGGRDVREYDLQALRDAVGIVLQKNVLFSGTMRENLKWGNPEASDETLWAACRAACADEFLERMPKGLDTDLGQGGVNVSGGQKQRLCIARTLLKKPKVLIFDDSTSAVDTATEAKIRAELAKLHGGHQNHHRPARHLGDGQRPDCHSGRRPHPCRRHPR